MYRLFKNQSRQVAVILPNAQRVEFLNYGYVTDREAEIEYLDKYAKTKECGVYVDAESTEVGEDEVAAIRAELVSFRRPNRNSVPKISTSAASSAARTAFQASIANTATIVSGKTFDEVEVSGVVGKAPVEVEGESSDAKPSPIEKLLPKK